MAKLVKENKCFEDGVSKKEIDGTILYEGNEIVNEGILKDSINNYDKIKIYAKSTLSHNIYQEVLTSAMNSSGGILTSLTSMHYTDKLYIRSARMTLIDRSFTLENCNSVVFTDTPSLSINETDTYTILKIVGIKY